MRRTRIWGREVALQGGPWTLVEYKREFGADLIADLIAAEKQVMEEESADLDVWLRIGWAMERTADAQCPRFEEWCRSFGEFTLADGEGAAFVSVIDSACAADLFRPRASRFARLRRKVRERWLGWLSRRRRARETRVLAR